MKYDLLIAGGGPAGLTAAIYGARAGLKTAVIEKMFAGGQMALTPEVGNYPGLDGLSGAEIAIKMQQQAQKSGAEFIYEEITGFDLESKTVTTAKSVYEGEAMVLAMGAFPRKTGLEGEEKFAGAGVSYCATCDGAFFKGKTVCVIGGGNTALEDALFLANLAEKVYIIHRREEFRGQAVLQEKVKAAPNIIIKTPYVPLEFMGDAKITGLKIKRANGDETEKIAADGVFIAIGTQPRTELVKGAIELDENGYIIAGEDTKTSAAGVFAAGDIRRKGLRQIATAVADGAAAGYFAGEYILGK